MLDLKSINAAVEQLQEERGIPKERIIGAIEDALAHAYKKDYGKKGQVIKAKFDLASGKVDFYQVKKVLDESMIKPAEEDEEEGDERVQFNEEHHILIDDARKIKRGASPGDELVFPLEERGDYGRIAAQTAKQVIIQRIREAERESVLQEYGQKSGDVVAGSVQRIERGNVFVDLGRGTGFLPYDSQIPGEHYRQGERIKAYLESVEEGPRGVNIRLSRTNPHFIAKLFEFEAPEIASGTVEIKAVAREAGNRSKIAVVSYDENIDPIGACVGQRGVRVATVINEIGGEKIDIIEWSENPKEFITQALSPAKVLSVELDQEHREARVKVAEDQFSLAIGRGGQNVRLAAKLTGFKIDIVSPSSEMEAAPEEETEPEPEQKEDE